ncbi:citrate synthase [Tuwongella immobilis]|uniref:Citrate synthase n=1 Tax=Tuwongella immobilis TaxID=692036 RepID=A0A6C2YQ55_9BACT|nr:citrate synthase [Tuwongella immobilis]VIP03309.1 citrate synthase : Citrate synthase OS=Gloeocapsa sp. PCC 7428 GN=Glo7428_1192 PE=3 SV=1: Citrate_synt [Tuwongella immobilis]VTS03989.1 citrate synthase : Citrate synthase OS=Gloeocapsa sp. PCC 7428 GN=Glo7428_1192 PE=3 SV=1: Citrate_synt [Tuwongella immobilis]
MSEMELRPGLADVPVAESAISFIDGKRARLEYRGIAAETLAKESSFEETTWLLLKGDLPTQKELAEFNHDLRSRRKLKYKLIDLIKSLPENGHPMDALQSSVSALGMFYPSRDVGNYANNWEATLRLTASLPTLVAAFSRIRNGDEAIEPREDLDHAANFYYMMFGKEPSAATRKVLDACLILHAEHNMNASTFTARVTGSTLANPYSVVSAAVGSLSGPLHGGANEEVLGMLDAIGTKANVQSWLENAIATKAKIMGFGHRVYKVKDPRATVLQELAENMFAETGRPAKYEVAIELERVANGLLGPKGIYPNVDFFSGVVYQSLGIPTDLFTPIFAVARVAGWLAHWLEQLKNNRIYRPEQVFVGKTNVDYIPLEKRP